MGRRQGAWIDKSGRGQTVGEREYHVGQVSTRGEGYRTGLGDNIQGQSTEDEGWFEQNNQASQMDLNYLYQLISEFILFNLCFQINLLSGLPSVLYNETCTAGAGTVLLEFGILSRLLGDPTFENLARKAVAALWKYRSMETGLFGEQ